MNVLVYLVGRVNPLYFEGVHVSWAADPRGVITMMEVFSGPRTNDAPVSENMIASWHVNHVAGWCKAEPEPARLNP